MYYPNPSSVTQAIDAATGDLLWEYRRPIPKDIATYVGGLETVNRSIAIHGGLIIDTANDGYVYALDAVTGELAWETQIVDYETEPARHSTGPIIAAGRVISGAKLPSAPGPRSLLHRRPRRGYGRGAVAPAADPGTGRARQRDVGRPAVREPAPRRLLDGAGATTRRSNC